MAPKFPSWCCVSHTKFVRSKAKKWAKARKMVVTKFKKGEQSKVQEVRVQGVREVAVPGDILVEFERR